MKTPRTKISAERASVLQELQHAILAGATWQYARLLALAAAVGVTDEEIDVVATDAVRALLSNAEQPLTNREVAR